jgi:hypothetical protein
MKVSFLSLCLLAFLFALPTKTFAVDFTVNLTTDQGDANDIDGICDIDLVTAGQQCSLRAAVQQANRFGSDDRIFFNLPVNSTIILTGGEIFISFNFGTLEIVGTGANNLTISGGGRSRIFFIVTENVTSVSKSKTISGVTLTGGNGMGLDFSGAGGAIYASGGPLTLDSVHVKGNSGIGGGGMYSSSANYIINSTFSDNTSDSVGGGGAYFAGGITIIRGSTFSANTGFNCAGFRNSGESLTVVNSTISGNTTTGNSGFGGVGGGFCNYGESTLRNVTITNNTAVSGGGIYNFDTNIFFDLGNTIVAGNTATNASASPDFRGLVSSTSSYNLIGNNQGMSGITNGTNGNQVGTPTSPINPLLGPLTLSNGGPTPTHALLPGSPAIDKGLNALAVDPSSGTALVFDQRGVNFPRIRDGNGDGTAIVDIGAFEFLSRPTAASVSVSGRVLSSGRRGVSGAVVHLTKQNGEIQTTRTNTFGYYTFKDIAVGETYIINVYSKRYQFNPQVVSLTEDLSGLNFTAQ